MLIKKLNKIYYKILFYFFELYVLIIHIINILIIFLKKMGKVNEKSTFSY